MRLPEPVIACLRTLKSAGYPSYLVGGSVRDLLLGREPEDYDVATAAPPAVVRELFPRTVFTGPKYGTVTVLLSRPIEVTTFRRDGPYSDGRHPSHVVFSGDLREDLARRDFTINAMAFDPLEEELVDPWDGRADLKRRLLRAVGDPARRFREDGLRLLRAARFVSQLSFQLEEKTLSALKAEAGRLALVAAERRGAEFALLITGPNVRAALDLLVESGLMRSVVPELLAGQGVRQSRLHPDDVLGHNIKTCSLTPPQLELRLAGLLHDVGKPERWEEGPYGRFFPGHAARSAALVPVILRRLRFSRRTVRTVALLVAHHMFFWRAPQGLAPVRRLAAGVGWENFPAAIALIQADRLAIWGDPEAAGVRELAEAAAAVEAEHPPLTAADLALSSAELIAQLGLKPGPRLGALRRRLLELVWEDPGRNNKKALLDLARREISTSSSSDDK
ncbi:MAG TPA: HD domain-containing protein [Firmicutes bacterium]|uniref:CCA tRNA nucleotidyltransferase n=1 Tax=Gelria sp. Kuro-4 TaxID=2796927 RepID=UPI00198EE088|nr:HD domain-containing protein [Gelria sp. Kuro-4]BCV23399.1 HDIG domain-containing protein [Gelria sp. Kuro-4]HHV56744.1 HD domain-containing protein [Bacillota bacterium]